MKNPLRFIGRGSCFNIKECNTSAYYKNNNNMLLIDCGEDVFSRLVQKKILDGIENIWVIITHLHSDHCGSLSSLIFYMHFVKNTKVNICIPPTCIIENTKFIQNLVTMLDIQGVSKEFYSLRSEIETSSFRIPIEFSIVNHVPELISYSISLKIDDVSIYYSGDNVDICPDPENYDLIFQEVSFYDSGVHCYYEKLNQYDKHKDKVYLMHIDDSSKINFIQEKGFKIVETKL